jgi:hypothetical protein
MPLYFFDIHDGGPPVLDDAGVELVDRTAAGRAAIAKLRAVGRDGPPSMDVRRTFAIHVRDEFGQPVLKTAAVFAFQWLDT